MKITDEAVEAAAKAHWENGNSYSWADEHVGVRADGLADMRAALVAAAPYMLAGVATLAGAWEARGEYDMEVAKAIKDEYIASEILGHGAQMVENARHIRNAIGAAK